MPAADGDWGGQASMTVARLAGCMGACAHLLLTPGLSVADSAPRPPCAGAPSPAYAEPGRGRRPKRVKAHGSVLDAMLGVFTVRHRPQEDPTPIDRLRQPHSGWLARRAGGHLRRSSVLHAMSSPRLDPGLLRTTRRPGAVIFRPFPLHAITARNKAPLTDA